MQPGVALLVRCIQRVVHTVLLQLSEAGKSEDLHPRQRLLPAEHLGFAQRKRTNAESMVTSGRSSSRVAKRCYLVNGPVC